MLVVGEFAGGVELIKAVGDASDNGSSKGAAAALMMLGAGVLCSDGLRNSLVSIRDAWTEAGLEAMQAPPAARELSPVTSPVDNRGNL